MDFCLDAVQEAIMQYGCPKIFNTDQGCQFTSQEFTGLVSSQHDNVRFHHSRNVLFMDRLPILTRRTGWSERTGYS
jgi:transposase InsO family protein